MKTKLVITIFCLLAQSVVAFSQNGSYRKLQGRQSQYAGMKADTLVVATLDLFQRNRPDADSDEPINYSCTSCIRYICGDTTMVYTNEYYRQEGDKLYYLGEQENGPGILLMDFGLSVGEIFVSATGQRMQVVSVKDTLDGTARVLSLECPDNPRLTDKWMDGQGSLNTGVLPPSIAEALVSPTLVWLFDASWWLNTVLTNSDLIKIDKSSREYEDKSVSSIPWRCWFEADTLRVQGYTYSNAMSTNFFIAYINGNDIYLDKRVIGGGVYQRSWYKADLKYGSFKPGFYHIHYNYFVVGPREWDWDDVIDQFIECYLDTIVHCDGNPASVPDLIADQPTTAARGLYDLMGRRLASEPARGIFIRDGKKVRK